MRIESELDDLRSMEREIKELENKASELKRQHIMVADNFRKKYHISFEDFVEIYYV